MGLGSSATDASLLKLEFGDGTNLQNNGSMRSQKISFNGLSQAFEQTYTYDNLNRLKSATETVNSATTWKQTFNYDRYGNRTFDTINNNTPTLAASNSVTNLSIRITRVIKRTRNRAWNTRRRDITTHRTADSRVLIH